MGDNYVVHDMLFGVAEETYLDEVFGDEMSLSTYNASTETTIV